MSIEHWTLEWVCKCSNAWATTCSLSCFFSHFSSFSFKKQILKRTQMVEEIGNCERAPSRRYIGVRLKSCVDVALVLTDFRRMRRDCYVFSCFISSLHRRRKDVNTRAKNCTLKNANVHRNNIYECIHMNESVAYRNAELERILIRFG